MLIKETWVNESKGHILSDSGLYESYTDNIGELFKNCQRLYGRCISGMFIDSTDGKNKKVGWVFEKLEKYQDANEYFKMHTWVEIHAKQPTKTEQNHYLELNNA